MSSKESINLSEIVPGLISVLIPAYNHEQYVQQTIHSIIDQTYQNIELIVIDDGSTDSTWEKINELKSDCEKRFTRVVFQTQENAGTCKTLNRLIEQAKGEFIYLIASDDVSMPEAIQMEFEFLSGHNDYILAVGDNFVIDENGGRVALGFKMKSVPVGTKGSISTFGHFLQDRRRFDFSSSQFGSYELLWSRGNYVPNGYLIRKSVFYEIGGFTPLAPLEDYFLMFQISKYGKMKYIDIPLYSYRRHSACTSCDLKHMIDMTAKTLHYEMQQHPEQNTMCHKMIYYKTILIRILLKYVFWWL